MGELRQWSIVLVACFCVKITINLPAWNTPLYYLTLLYSSGIWAGLACFSAQGLTRLKIEVGVGYILLWSFYCGSFKLLLMWAEFSSLKFRELRALSSLADDWGLLSQFLNASHIPFHVIPAVFKPGMTCKVILILWIIFYFCLPLLLKGLHKLIRTTQITSVF